MLEDKEKLKLEFEYLKTIQSLFLVALFGVVAFVFNRELSAIVYIISFISIIILCFISYKIFKRITKIYKD